MIKSFKDFINEAKDMNKALVGVTFDYNRKSHTIKKIDNDGIIHTTDGLMYKMTTLKANGVEFPDPEALVKTKSAKTPDMNKFHDEMDKLQAQWKEIDREQENDPDIELEGGKVADSYGRKFNSLTKKMDALRKKYNYGQGDEYMTYDEIEKRARLIK